MNSQAVLLVGWIWNGDSFWVNFWKHVTSLEFLLFAVLAFVILCFGTQAVLYPLFYYGHRFRATSSIRMAYFLAIVTVVVLYLNFFWCHLSPLVDNYWFRLAAASISITLMSLGFILPKKRMR